MYIVIFMGQCTHDKKHNSVHDTLQTSNVFVRLIIYEKILKVKCIFFVAIDTSHDTHLYNTSSHATSSSFI